MRYKSVCALNVYKWMSFFNLGVLVTIAVASFGYANTEYVRLSGNAIDGSESSDAMANAAPDAEIESLVLKIYKAVDKCPPFRGPGPHARQAAEQRGRGKRIDAQRASNH